MLSLYSFHHHHHSVGIIIVMMLFTLYHQIIPLPPAYADTVTIIVDTDGTSGGGDVPCAAPAVDNGDCSLSMIFGSSGYLASYLSVPSHRNNQQFQIIVADHVTQIPLNASIPIQFPSACTNCSLAINGAHSDGTKTNVVPVVNRDTLTPPGVGFSFSHNGTPIVVENFHFQGFSTAAISVENISLPAININYNSFGSLGSGSLSNSHAVMVSNSANIVLDHNVFGGHSSDALMLAGASTTNARISNNFFGVSSATELSASLPSITGNALAISDNAHDNTIEGNNVFANTNANGVRIMNSNNNVIEAGNRFFNNADQAIALINAANNNVSSPSLTTAQKQGSNLLVTGQGISGGNIHFYRTTNASNPHVTGDTSGGEGFFFLDSATVDGSGDRDTRTSHFQFSLTEDIATGESVTAFQTSSLNSSQFSNNVTISVAPVPTITPTPTPTPSATITPTPTATTSPSPTATTTPTPNTAPIANAGANQTVRSSASVNLNGSLSSDPDGDSLTYQWEQSSTDSYQVSLSNSNTVSPTFIAPVISELQSTLHFNLLVSDSRGGIHSDTVAITISRSRTAPIANLQILPDVRVAPGTEIILDGSDSSFDSGTSTREYRFRTIQSGGSEINVTINQASRNDPQARVIIPGGLTRDTTFIFELTVSDGTATSAPVQQTVHAVPQASSTQLCTNEDPTANAGRNQNLTRPIGTIVTLNGQRSQDPNNTVLTYSWRQIPGGVTVDLRNSTAAVANFTIPTLTTLESTLSFELTVTNRCGGSDSATTRVIVRNNDLDSDGLDNAREAEIGTDPTKTDTDSDGIPDGVEINSNCMNALAADTDNDGRQDGQEDLNRNGITDGGETNPCIADTDIDTLPDGYEVNNGLNALNPNDAELDGDNDGLTNREEFVYKTNSRNPDTDGDGLKDGIEVKSTNKTSPIDDDTDNDGITDGNEDINRNGTTEAHETNPTRSDSDFDSLIDGQEIGLGKPQGKNTDLTKFQPDLDLLSKTSPLSPDTDGDGLIDGKEDANHNGSRDCGETDPLNSQNTVLSCSPTTQPTKAPVTTKQARVSSNGSIQVQKPIATVAQSISGGLVRLVSPMNTFSISVQGGTVSSHQSSLSFSVPVSIMVIPAILPATGIFF